LEEAPSPCIFEDGVTIVLDGARVDKPHNDPLGGHGGADLNTGRKSGCERAAALWDGAFVVSTVLPSFGRRRKGDLDLDRDTEKLKSTDWLS